MGKGTLFGVSVGPGDPELMTLKAVHAIEQADVIVRGVRSVKDFEYEREQAEMNRRLSGIETLLLFADPQFSSISSGILRELEHFGRDVSEFVAR